jgi:hypothetical protein
MDLKTGSASGIYNVQVVVQSGVYIPYTISYSSYQCNDTGSTNTIRANAAVVIQAAQYQVPLCEGKQYWFQFTAVSGTSTIQIVLEVLLEILLSPL